MYTEYKTTTLFHNEMNRMDLQKLQSLSIPECTCMNESMSLVSILMHLLHCMKNEFEC